MNDADVITVGVVIGIIVVAIIIILLASRNKKGVAVQYETQPERNKPDVFTPENNRPIGESLRPASLSFCPSCGRRLHGAAFICPYCKKHL
jgi:hypothetical protein